MMIVATEKYFIQLEDGTEITIDSDYDGVEDLWSQECEAHKGSRIVYHNFDYIDAEWLNLATIKKLYDIVYSVVYLSIPYWVVAEYCVHKGEDYFSFENCENDFLGVYENRDEYLQGIIETHDLQPMLDKMSTAFFGHTADPSTFLSIDAIFHSVGINNLVFKNAEKEGDRFYLFARH